MDNHSLFNFDELLLNCALELNRLRRHLAVNVLTWAAMLQDPSTYAQLPSQVPDLEADLGAPPEDSENAGSGELLDRVLRIQDSAFLDDGTRNSESGGEGIPANREEEQGSCHTSTTNSLVRSHRLGSMSSDLLVGSDSSDLEEEYEWRPIVSPFAALIDRPFSPIGAHMLSQDEDIDGSTEEAAVMERQSPIDGLQLQRLSAMQATDMCVSKILHKNSSASNLLDIFNSEAERFRGQAENDETASGDGCEQGDGPSHRRCSSDPFSPREEPLVQQLNNRLMPGLFNVAIGDSWGGNLKPHYSEPVADLFQPQGEHCSASGGVAAAALLKLPKQLSKVMDPGIVPLTDYGQVNLNGRSLIPPGSDDVVIPVFDAEPGSVIAHALASISYQKKLQQEVMNLQRHHPSQSEVPKALHDRFGSFDFQQQGFDGDVNLLPHQRHRSEGPYSLNHGSSPGAMYRHHAHILHRFEDDGLKMMPWSHAKFEVVSYYAPQFAKLRSRCLPGGEKSFIMSLSRCKP